MRILPNVFGMKKLTVIVRQPHGLHMRPSAAIAKLSNRTNMPLYFFSEDKGWKNVRNSLVSVLLMNIQEGAQLKLKAPKEYPKDIFNKIVKIVTSDDINVCTQYIK